MSGADALARDGFVALRSFATLRSDVGRLRGDAADLLAHHGRGGDSLGHAFGALERAAPPACYRVCQALARTFPAAAIAAWFREGAPLLGIDPHEVRHLVDATVALNKADVGRLRYDSWHVERDYYPRAPQVWTLWLPFAAPVRAADGPVELAVGSHRLELRSTGRKEVPGGLDQMPLDEAAFSACPRVLAELDLGDALVFGSGTAHRTAPNTSGEPRLALILRFGGAQALLDGGWERPAPRARRPEEWREDYGDVLWWRFPVVEPPHLGSPLDLGFEVGDFHGWTPLGVPPREPMPR